MLDATGFSAPVPSHVLPGLTWQVSEDIERCSALWRTLEREAQGRVFQSLDWARAWFAAIGAPSGASPRIVIGLQAGLPALLVPLVRTTLFGVPALVWLGDPWNDYNAPLARPDLHVPETPEARRAFWIEVAQVAGPASLFEWPKQSPTLGGRQNPFLHPDATPEDNGAYVLDLQPDLEALRTSIHSPKTWQGFERKLRKLQKEGTVTFERLDAGERAARTVATMLDWKVKSLRARGATNPFEDPAAVAFLVSLAETSPRVQVYTMCLDGDPVVAALCLREEGNLLLYQTSYDERVGRSSPGVQLIRSIFEDIAPQGVATFDFSFGDDAYKTEICNRRIEMTRALVALDAKGRLVLQLRKGLLGLRRAVKQNPAAYRAALAVNRQLGRLRGRG